MQSPSPKARESPGAAERARDAGLPTPLAAPAPRDVDSRAAVAKTRRREAISSPEIAVVVNKERPGDGTIARRRERLSLELLLPDVIVVVCLSVLNPHHAPFGRLDLERLPAMCWMGSASERYPRGSRSRSALLHRRVRSIGAPGDPRRPTSRAPRPARLPFSVMSTTMSRSCAM